MYSIALFVIGVLGIVVVSMSVWSWFTAEFSTLPGRARTTRYLSALYFSAESVFAFSSAFGVEWMAAASAIVWAGVGLVVIGWVMVLFGSIVDGSYVREQMDAMRAAAMSEASPLISRDPELYGVLDAIWHPDADMIHIAITEYLAGRVLLSDVERAPLVMWVADPVSGVIKHARGSGLDRYGLRHNMVVGSTMDDWPSPELWRSAVNALMSGRAQSMVLDCPDWIRPSRVGYAITDEGMVIGVCIPEPTPDDLRALG